MEQSCGVPQWWGREIVGLGGKEGWGGGENSENSENVEEEEGNRCYRTKKRVR